MIEDMVNLGEGIYGNLELPVLLRIYRDCRRLLELTLTEGEHILKTIEVEYHLR